jgi:hypothetical protein
VLVRFEGERPLMDLLERWSTGHEWADAPSFVRPDGSSSPAAEPVRDLDALPLPARDLTGHLVGRGLSANVQGSRGCLGACRYCCAPQFPHPAGCRWRARSPARLADELEELVGRWDARLINFVDDDFLGPPAEAGARAAAFARELAARRLRIAFSIQARPEALSAQVADALAGAGLGYAFVGIESLDAAVLAGWGRSPAGAGRSGAIERLRAKGVEVQAGAILFHPGSTLAGVLAEAGELRRRGLFNYRVAVSRLTALPGSALWDDLEREGVLARGARGPQPVPLGSAELEDAYRWLCEALAPVRPVWVHAACALPPAALAERLGDGVELPFERRDAGAVRAVLDMLDDAAWESLAEAAGGGAGSDALAARRRDNLGRAEAAARHLEGAGWVDSADMLREAIRGEAGL